METLILRYGVIAIFLGSGIEGEPFAIAGGVLAHKHWLSIQAALGAAIAGSCMVDQFWFHMSRLFHQSRLVQRMVRRPAFQRSLDRIDRHAVWFVLLFRFAYGLRAVAPAAIGASKVPTRVFVPLNVAAAAIWGTLFTGAGYLLGPTFERAVEHHGTVLTIGGIAISAAMVVMALRRGNH